MSDLMVIEDEKVDLIKRTVAKDATNDELELFLYQARRMGLDPLARQIHFQKFKSKSGKDNVSFITTIDGYRLIADRTGKYAGNAEPTFEGEITSADYGGGQGPRIPAKATITVFKIVAGEVRPFTNSAYWQEYYPGNYRGHMWRKMPHVMLAKVAEAGALRKAFPADLSGAYTADEMEQASVQIVDVKREVESLAVIVDHEPEHVIEGATSSEEDPPLQPDRKVPPPPPQQKPKNGNGPRVTKSMLRELHALGTFIYMKGWDAERARRSKEFGVESSKDWPLKDYYDVVEELKDLKEKQIAAEQNKSAE